MAESRWGLIRTGEWAWLSNADATAEQVLDELALQLEQHDSASIDGEVRFEVRRFSLESAAAFDAFLHRHVYKEDD